LDACENLNESITKENLILLSALKVQQDRVDNLEYKNALLLDLVNTGDLRIGNLQAQYKSQIKKERGKRAKITFLAIGQAVLIVLILI
jgi:hypothetical protein